jgi:RHS repeat-associated protein
VLSQSNPKARSERDGARLRGPPAAQRADGSAPDCTRGGAPRYAPWLGRWTAADPLGLVDGLNLYRYSRDNPVNFSDPGGTESSGAGGAPTRDDERQGQEGAGPGPAPDRPPEPAKGKGSSEAPKPIPAPAVPQPNVVDKKLNNLVRDLYKGAQTKTPIGTGSTADAIRSERQTGNPVGGKFHTQKGTEYVKALENWLSKNQQASAQDRAAAQAMLNDLKLALAGK